MIRNVKKTKDGPGYGLRGPGRPPAPAGGFALLDLMVSVLLLGLFLVPLAISRNNVILSAGAAARLREARFLALQKLGEMELENLEEIGSASGSFGDAHPGFSWEAQVETLLLMDVVGRPPSEEDELGTGLDFPGTLEEGEEAPPEVFRLTLTVRFRAGEEGFDLEEEEGMFEEERKIRPLDRIVMVRYVLKEPDQTDAPAGGG